jgi:hypothetical protein
MPPVKVASSMAQRDIATVVGGGVTSPPLVAPSRATGAVAAWPLSVVPLLTYVIEQAVVEVCAPLPRMLFGTYRPSDPVSSCTGCAGPPPTLAYIEYALPAMKPSFALEVPPEGASPPELPDPSPAGEEEASPASCAGAPSAPLAASTLPPAPLEDAPLPPSVRLPPSPPEAPPHAAGGTAHASARSAEHGPRVRAPVGALMGHTMERSSRSAQGRPDTLESCTGAIRFAARAAHRRTCVHAS